MLLRRTVQPFTEAQIELATTFADQAVIAIENVRLFDEIQDKSRQLAEASERKSQFLATHIFAEKGPYNAWLLALSVAAIVAPMLWAALRWPGVARKIGAVLAVVVLAFVVAVLLHVITLPGLTTQAWQSIAAASLGVLVLFLAAGFWPVRRRLWGNTLRRPPGDSS